MRQLTIHATRFRPETGHRATLWDRSIHFPADGEFLLHVPFPEGAVDLSLEAFHEDGPTMLEPRHVPWSPGAHMTFQLIGDFDD